MITFENVTKSYGNGAPALSNLNIEIEEGEFVFVVGTSGSGKSTFIKLLLKELEPTEGKIIVNDTELRKLRSGKTAKYRRKVAYGKIKQDIADILSMLCKRKSVKIVEAEICPDHVHMLVEIPPSISVSYFVGYLKGKSTLMIFERHANLKYKYGNRHFWCRGYYVDTVGKNAKKIQEYIANQLQDDLEYDQMTLKEYIDPFTGEPVKRNK